MILIISIIVISISIITTTIIIITILVLSLFLLILEYIADPWWLSQDRTLYEGLDTQSGVSARPEDNPGGERIEPGTPLCQNPSASAPRWERNMPVIKTLVGAFARLWQALNTWPHDPVGLQILSYTAPLRAIHVSPWLDNS